MLTVLVFLIVLLAGGCASYQTRGNLIRHQNATVRIIVTCKTEEGTSDWFGSGVVISNRRVLTAGHLAKACEGAEFTAVDGETAYPLSVLKLDVENDLSIMINTGPTKFNKPSINWGPEPKRMSNIYIVTGAPREDVRMGLLNHWNLKQGPNMKNSLIIEPGNSGSGIYDDLGRLIGICTHTTFCGNGQFCGGRATSLWDKKNWLK